jgi:sodium-dependent dicarboxylate transporter 2/3/5
MEYIGSPVSFTQWLLVGIPLGIIIQLLCMLLLFFIYVIPSLVRLRKEIKKQKKDLELQIQTLKKHLLEEPNSPDHKREQEEEKELESQLNRIDTMDISVFNKEYNQLGRVTIEEITIAFLFFVMIVLWTTRSMDFGSGAVGWDVLFKKNFTSEGVVAILISSLLFIIPAYNTPPDIAQMEVGSGSAQYPTLMDWRAMAKFPWDMILVFGGGFAIADGFKESGLNTVLAQQFAFLQSLHPFLIVAIVTIIVSIMTQVTSNTATIQIFLPILTALSTSLKTNPALLMAPGTFACSYAFTLPVSTPPNAIAFSYSEGRVTIFNMVVAGGLLTILSIIVTISLGYALVPAVFPA